MYHRVVRIVLLDYSDLEAEFQLLTDEVLVQQVYQYSFI